MDDVWDLAKNAGVFAVPLMLWLLNREQRGREKDRAAYDRDRKGWDADKTELVKAAMATNIAIKGALENVFALFTGTPPKGKRQTARRK